MKKLFFILTVIGMLTAFGDAHAARKKVGVVLSGGGAKGVAHINAIKVIEEAGIPIDYITGTSMGAIIGGLYAIGYDTRSLDSMVRTQDWTFLLSDKIPRRDLSFGAKETDERYLITVPLTNKKKFQLPSGLVGGQNVYNLLTELTIGYHDSISFSTLPIPFACVAYDLVSGKDIVLDEGILPLAIRASMSIPGAFEPVRIGDKVLIDGGISNNFPADVIKAMGADIVIGIDVGATVRDENKLNTLADLFNQITYFTGVENYDHNIKLVDLLVKPDIKPYNAGSFGSAAIDTLLVRGERAMREHWDDLLALKEKIGIEGEFYAEDIPEPDLKKSIKLESIRFEGLTSQKESSMIKISRLKENTTIHPSDLNSAVQKLQGTGLFSEVSYSLEGHPPTHLTFHVKESSRNSISLGFRFDTEEMAAILLRVNMAIKYQGNSHFELVGRLSENPYGKLSYIIGNDTDRKLTISYRYKYNNIGIYSHGKKLTNSDFSQHTVDVNFANIKVRNFMIAAGIYWEYFGYHSMLTTRGVDINDRSQGLFNYYGTAQFESLDSRTIPREGISFNADYTLYTSNFFRYRGRTPFQALHLNFLSALSVSKRVTFLPGVFGRVLIGHNVGFQYQNMLGGTVPGRYRDHQMPFVGVHHIDVFDNSVLGVKLDFRVRLWQRNYVSLKTNYLKHDNNFFDLLDGEDVFGVGLGYCYRSFLGPLEFILDYSNYTKKVGAYFSLGYYF